MQLTNKNHKIQVSLPAPTVGGYISYVIAYEDVSVKGSNTYTITGNISAAGITTILTGSSDNITTRKIISIDFSNSSTGSILATVLFIEPDGSSYAIGIHELQVNENWNVFVEPDRVDKSGTILLTSGTSKIQLSLSSPVVTNPVSYIVVYEDVNIRGTKSYTEGGTISSITASDIIAGPSNNITTRKVIGIYICNADTLSSTVNVLLITDTTHTVGTKTLQPNESWDVLSLQQDVVADVSVFSGTATQVSAGVYTASIAGVTSYTAGVIYIIKFTSASDGASTLNINSLGAVNIYKNALMPIAGGDINANQEIELVYDGTNFQAIGLAQTQLLAYVHNSQGSVITKGQVVYAYQATGNKMSVRLAKADTDATSAKTIGVVYDTSIGVGANGYIIIQGVIEGVNTSAYSAGDTLYLSGTTAGDVTNVKPYAPIHLVYVGIVERANAGNGQIYVRCQNGYELDEIHDVDLVSVAPVNNDILTYVTGTPDLWKPRSISTILGYTPQQAITLTTTGTSGPATLAGGALNIPQYSGASGVTSVGGTVPINSSGGTTPTISIDNAKADGTSKGAATFNASDFNDDGAGLISIDYANGQKASNIQDGFLKSSDWSAFDAKLTSLNTLTATTQTFATGTTGSDFNISSATSTHTFNIPDAGASARGLITTGTQTLAGAKTFSSAPTFSTMTAGSLLFAGASGLLSQDNTNLFWDDTNNRLGIGTSTPAYRLEVKGTITASSALAQLVNIEPTLTAAANNDFLVATNINATFSLGAFTGTSSYLQRWQTAGTTRSYIRSLGNQTWNLATSVVEAGQIEYSTPSGNTGILIYDWDTVNSTYINRYNFANQGTYFYQGFHSINTLGGMALFNTSHNLVLGYTGTPTDAGYKLDVNGTTRTQGDFTISDTKNVILGTSTGTKIGTATSQKLSFWNATPIVQPTTAVAAATRVGGGGTTVTDTDTFDGYTIAKVVKALRNAGILA